MEFPKAKTSSEKTENAASLPSINDSGAGIPKSIDSRIQAAKPMGTRRRGPSR